MNDQFVATVLLYLVPLFALLVTWKKPLSKALGWIAASEILGLLLFLPCMLWWACWGGNGTAGGASVCRRSWPIGRRAA